MAFNSLAFAVFLSVVFLLHWMLPVRLRWVFLLAASLVFYQSWGTQFVLLLCCTTLFSYASALLIERTETPGTKKLLLTLSVCLLLTPLIVFKYLGFFSQCVSSVLSLISIPLHPFTRKLLLPVGISFYSFQAIGYVVDVYRGRVRAERHAGCYALFVCFFPQIVSGPIGRADALIPQLKAGRDFDYTRASRGLRLIVWGLFKKMVIADHLAVLVNAAYGDLTACGGLALLLAMLLFSVEIYCDFSGYSDIAVGCARLLGIELCENFRSPYLSGSIREFWGRWHISLSTWFRDYVYIPLGGNRVGPSRHALNLMITFLASGLWHGANGTFLVWGGLHGLARVAEEVVRPGRVRGGSGVRRALRVLCVFLFVSAAWVFFRADTLSDACYLITHLFSGISSPGAYLLSGLRFTREHLQLSKLLLLFSLALLAAWDTASLRVDVLDWLSARPACLRWGLYLLVGLLTLLCHYTGNVSFIYFQF